MKTKFTLKVSKNHNSKTYYQLTIINLQFINTFQVWVINLEIFNLMLQILHIKDSDDLNY